MAFSRLSQLMSLAGEWSPQGQDLSRCNWSLALPDTMLVKKGSASEFEVWIQMEASLPSASRGSLAAADFTLHPLKKDSSFTYCGKPYAEMKI